MGKELITPHINYLNRPFTAEQISFSSAQGEVLRHTVLRILGDRSSSRRNLKNGSGLGDVVETQREQDLVSVRFLLDGENNTVNPLAGRVYYLFPENPVLIVRDQKHPLGSTLEIDRATGQELTIAHLALSLSSPRSELEYVVG